MVTGRRVVFAAMLTLLCVLSLAFAPAPEGPAIEFDVSNVVIDLPDPTVLAYGPDGRLYVGLRGGGIRIYTLDDDNDVVAEQIVTTIEGLTNNEILGLSFNPHDPPDPIRLYVSHNALYANGGSCFEDFSAYSGQVSVLEGPDFDVIDPLVTGLPVSNHDHGVNATTFDNNGDMLICVGGNTNAGVPACLIGGMPESPLSGAILKAELSRPDFNGEVTYREIDGGLPNNDQGYGDIVEVEPGSHVTVHASGLRNAFDLVLTSWGSVYATDNGPNIGFGPASTGPDTEGDEAGHADELCLIEYNQYYGHPNRNRGMTDDRQNIYHDLSGPTEPGEFVQTLVPLTSSTNGVIEYRSTVFDGAMQGELMAKRYNNATFRIALSSDRRSVTGVTNFPVSLTSLDIEAGPGGVIFATRYGDDRIKVAEPVITDVDMRAYDVFPWRAPATGGHPFIIGGANFGTMEDTTVTFGGVAATLTSVSSTRIRGVIPPRTLPTTAMLDVVVNSDLQQQTLTESFRYLLPVGNEPEGWSTGADLPIALGEVAAGIIDGVLYVAGEGNDATLAYNIATGTWAVPGGLAERPFPGHHHAAEVIDGKLYLFGGLGHGSAGKVQIYDPILDMWTTGAPLPWAAGSPSSAVIDGLVYVCGGIVSGSTVTDTHSYDPVADTWSGPLAPMIDGRNHAASATDGVRLYVFGGRGPGSGDGNVVANGYADVQIYDPLANMWESSNDVKSILAPLPQARGGTGKAVFADGEFYVFGGETLTGDGAGPDNTYDRVDVYHVESSTWRLESPMAVAMHGIFPVRWGGRIYLPGGGTEAGNSQSQNLLIYDLPPTNSEDVDGDGLVTVSDVLLVLADWGPCGVCDADVNGDGFVDVTDLLLVLGAWG